MSFLQSNDCTLYQLWTTSYCSASYIDCSGSSQFITIGNGSDYVETLICCDLNSNVTTYGDANLVNVGFCSAPQTPTPTPTQTQTPTSSITPTPTKTPRPTPTQTGTPTQTPTQTGTPTPTPSTTPILCGEGVTNVNPGSSYYYTDCCGNFQQGTENGVLVSLDYTKPSNGIVKLNVATSVSCPSPTPTATPTTTPTATPTPTVTTTSTLTPTPTKTPRPTPTISQVFSLKNECEVFTLFDMGISCHPLVQPSSSTSLDGILSIKITGGTSPYSIYWADGQRSQTLVGIPQGSYEVTVVDYYGDYTASTICSLYAPTATPTPTQTSTPTVTPSGICPKLCFIGISSNSSYGPLQFICNGNRNGKTTWTTIDGQYNIVWISERNRWEVMGSDPTIPFNPIGGGIFASTSTSFIPDSSWSIVGGTNTYSVLVTQGDCPSTIPIQATVETNNNSCNTTSNCNGKLIVNAQYGYPPYQFSINQGVTYQSNNVFENLCNGNYNVIVRDSQNNTVSVNGTVGFDAQPITYQLSLSANTSATQVYNSNNYTSKTTYYEIVSTPPLPIGVTMNFNLTVSSVKTYNGPGSGNILDTIIITENGVAKSPITTQTTTQFGDRLNCNPETYTGVTEADTYQLTIGNNYPVLITDTSTLIITNGEGGIQSNCLTNLKQEIFAQFTQPDINGCNCCTVVVDSSFNTINSNEITYLPIVE